MLRDPAETALNDLLVALKDAAVRYQDAAQMAEAPDLARTITELARERTALANQLSTRILARGALPGAPDPDREVLGDLFTHLKKVFVGERPALVGEVADTEQRLITLCDAALAQVADQDTQELLGQLRACFVRTAGAFGSPPDE